MTAPAPTDVEFPEKLACLFERWRFKFLDSGRGAAKSWSAADALLILGKDPTTNHWRSEPQPLRFVCARETMESLKKSSYALLGDRCRALGLGSEYEFQQRLIKGRSGTEFIFTGLSDPDSIKSLEGADVVWIEEAQSVTKRSWDIVIPTMRKEGVDRFGDWFSEIWATWNPRLTTDETYIRAKVQPRTGTKTVTLSWRDNPWFPKVLDIERQDCLRLDPVGYRNIWEGEPLSSVNGAIFGDEIEEATKDGRIGNFPRDRMRPVDTFWDLGYGDLMSVWFVQYVDGWYRLVDYQQDSMRTIEWWMIQLQQRGYLYGTHWLPWDGVDAEVTNAKLVNHSGKSPEQLMREAGFNVRLAPKLLKSTRINAGRTIFPQCQFHDTMCRDGMTALRMYQWGEPNAHGMNAREPLHDEYSHGADAFTTFAVCAKQPKAPQQAKKPTGPPRPSSAWA